MPKRISNLVRRKKRLETPDPVDQIQPLFDLLKKWDLECLSKTLIGEILNASSTGKMIIDYFKINSRLNNNIRVLLVDSIISYVITKNIPMSINLADSIATYIVAMFPSEVKDTYFMKDGHNKNPKGKIYAKYYNSMRTLKTSGLVPSKERVKSAVERHTHTQRRHDKEFEPEDDIHYMIDQIQNDTNCSFPELEKLWKGTTKYRINSIQNSSSTT
ncbi:PREDICTED: uncharacterized protein LOC107165674 [Diuraphis noxia]|uniref:uncharacterized protein LOC107165674 n=1 Tax=Diuraphis noxia TaxID=143948 RepID=UPI00076390CA|nr:PREDICTED: uncharacterized protein LOC107165674 [Diuraphis noxia]